MQGRVLYPTVRPQDIEQMDQNNPARFNDCLFLAKNDFGIKIAALTDESDES